MAPVGRFDIDDLDEYYANCVIGGPGSFLIPVTDWANFPEAIRRKLVLELAGPWSPTWQRYAAEEAGVLKVSALGALLTVSSAERALVGGQLGTVEAA